MKVLFKIKSGSHLYGLNTPTSDLDYVGVYVEDSFEDFIDPFNTKDEMDMSIKSKKENGKNDKDAVDEKYFHIKKFIKLCADNNPNILEMLFVPEDCIEYVDPDFKSLILDHPEMFVNVKLIDRFIGYAKSQEQKSYTKSENYVLLNTGLNSLKRVAKLKTMQAKMREAVLHIDPELFKGKANQNPVDIVYEIGDMKFPSGITIKEAIARIEDRFSRASHRIEGIFINRYEPKFMSHTIRLLDEGYQLLNTGKIEFPFKGKAFEDIMNVKFGKTLIEEIPELVNQYKERLAELEANCQLPKTADYNAINCAYNKLVLTSYAINICHFMDKTGLYTACNKVKRLFSTNSSN